MKRPMRFLHGLILAVVLPAYSACTPMAGTGTGVATDARRPLLAPPGYYQQVTVDKDKDYTCPDFPEPHTGPLVFASKYEGGDSSKSQLNEEAESRYKQ